MTETAIEAAPADEAGAEDQSAEQMWKDLAKAEADKAAAEGEAPAIPSEDVPEEEPTTEPAEPDAEAAPEPDKPEQTGGELEKLRHQYESNLGRIRAQEKEIEKLRKQITEAATKPPGDNDETRKQREERLKRAVDDYGDVLSPVQEEILALRSELSALKSGREQDGAAAQQRLDQMVQEETARLQSMCPDFGPYLRQHGAAFQAWIEDQPRLIRDAAERNRAKIVDADGAAYVFSAFKAHMAPGGQPETLPAKRQAQLRGASTTRSPVGRAAVSELPHEDDAEGWWKYWQRKDAEAQRR